MFILPVIKILLEDELGVIATDNPVTSTFEPLVVVNVSVFVVDKTCNTLPAVIVSEAPKSIDVPFIVRLGFANLALVTVPSSILLILPATGIMASPNLLYHC